MLASLLPERCQSCGGPAAAGLCADCQACVTRLENPCTGCGLEQPVGACPRTGRGWHIESLTAPFHYKSPLNGYIQALKFGRSRVMGRALGLMLLEVLEHRGGASQVNALVPVPLHRRRLRERGFNQAFEIARPVAAGLGLPLLIRGIGRQADTQPQTLLGARDRRENIRGAFRTRRDLQALNVAIVDDVITTGATVNALAASLRDAGASTVHAWALARTVPGGGSR